MFKIMLWWTRYNIQQYRKAKTIYSKNRAINEMVYTERVGLTVQNPASPCYYTSCKECLASYIYIERLK